MTIKTLYFWIIVITILIFMLYKMVKAVDEKNNNKEVYFSISIILFIIYIVVMYFYFYPNIYVITSKNTYHTEKLILPSSTDDGLNLEYGNDFSYVINKSNETLNVNTITYESLITDNNDELLNEIVDNEYPNVEEFIEPNFSKKIIISKVDYILENPDPSLSSGRKKTKKYSINF
jgi:predicted PurR-regulated permease PerM